MTIDRTILVAAGIVALITGCGGDATTKPRGPHWNDKALPSVRAAERRVGGFDADERREYRIGIQHIGNAHGKLGALTIAQVIDQERGREQKRAAAADLARERAQRAADISPKVSAYAKDVRLMLQLDDAGIREMAQHARDRDLTAVYGTASEGLRGVDMLSGLANKKPEGFDRTQAAVEDYLGNMRARYEAAETMVNDPSPKNNYAFRAAEGSDFGVQHIAAVVHAFDKDVDGLDVDANTKKKLKSRLRGGS